MVNGTLTGDDVDEATFGHVPSAITSTNAQAAEDAGRLDGRDSTEFLATTGKAADADKLDGRDSANFLSSDLFGSSAINAEGARLTSRECFLGEVWLTATAFAPPNTVPLHGQELDIAPDEALFSLLGTTYGGNGVTKFKLPDLRDAEPKGRSGVPLTYVMCRAGIFPSRP